MESENTSFQAKALQLPLAEGSCLVKVYTVIKDSPIQAVFFIKKRLVVVCFVRKLNIINIKETEEDGL